MTCREKQIQFEEAERGMKALTQEHDGIQDKVNNLEKLLRLWNICRLHVFRKERKEYLFFGLKIYFTQVAHDVHMWWVAFSIATKTIFSVELSMLLV